MSDETRSYPSGSDPASMSDRIATRVDVLHHKPPAIGDVIAGKYRVDSVLGSGGMGVVVGVTHAQLGTKAAIKYLTPVALARPDIVERFAREARIAARLKSEHVVRVLDVGTLETGEPYLLMERLEGSDLREILKQRGPLPIHEALGYVLQACEALEEAHAAGVVHRDLKPSNLFLTTRPDGTPLVKIVDFGISKLLPNEASLDGGEGTLTTGTELVGSPLYMSPEQVKSASDVDARADIWALGSVLFRLISGQPAFGAKTPAEIFVAILTQPTPALRAFRPDAPPELEAVIARCLRKERHERFRTVAELANALRGCVPVTLGLAPGASHLPAPPKSQRGLHGDTMGSRSASVLGVSPSLPPPAPRRGRAFAALALLVAMGAMGAALIVKSRARTAEAQIAQAARPVPAPEPAPIASEPGPPAVTAAPPPTMSIAAPVAAPSASSSARTSTHAPRWTPPPAPAPKPKGYDDSSYGGRR